MDNDFAAWLEQFDGQAFELHQQHLNPAFVKMLRAINFEKRYVRGEGRPREPVSGYANPR